jgi:hypothetical protein
LPDLIHIDGVRVSTALLRWVVGMWHLVMVGGHHFCGRAGRVPFDDGHVGGRYRVGCVQSLKWSSKSRIRALFCQSGVSRNLCHRFVWSR